VSVYQFGPFDLDASRTLLLCSGEPVALGPKVVETLLTLVERPGDVVTKEAMLDQIWPEGFVDEANLAQNVHVLRKVLRSRWDVNAIETVPRRGYRFTAEVRFAPELPSARPLPSTRPLPAAARGPRLVWQSAIASLCVVIVCGLLAFAAPHRVTTSPPLSATGARLYEIGHYYWNTRTQAGVTKSLAYFARVIDSDPANARGYAALAAANAIMGDYEYGHSKPGQYFALARAYAKKALALNPNCSDAYAVLGMVGTKKTMRSNSELAFAMSELRRAIALDPADGPAHQWYGSALLMAGRVNEGYAELRRAADVDPLSVATTAWLGDAAYLNGRYAEAIAYANETLDLAPNRSDAFYTLGLAYEARGEMPLAIAAFKRFAKVCPSCRFEAAALLAGAYARANRPAEARAELDFARAHPDDVHPEDVAVALVAVGEREDGLAWMRRVRKGESIRATFDNDPRFVALRHDPQFRHVAQNA